MNDTNAIIQQVLARNKKTFIQTTLDFNKSKEIPIVKEVILSRSERLKLQRQVKLGEIELAYLECVKQCLPYLLPHQHEDVVKAERWLWKLNEKAILFTNSVGTGKTFVGGGIMLRQRVDTLIITPTDKKNLDWQEELKLLGLNVYKLESIKDKGRKGINVTTYANFRQNTAIQERGWGILVYDESHNIMQNQKGTDTDCLQAHRDTTLKKGTKVIFLSATPFSYHKNLEYADGYLFDMGSDERIADLPSEKDMFYIDNFGYRFEKGKLLEPDVGTDVNTMEREFADKLLSSGAMSTRKIMLDYDYSREFIKL